MKRMLLVLLCSGSTLALADTCLQVEKIGHEGDSRYYDYGRCRPAPNAPNQTYDSLGTIGQQLQGMMSRDNGNDRGYSDAERDKHRREAQQFNAEQSARRAAVRYGASVELGGLDYAPYLFSNAAVTAEQLVAIRAEIGAAISSGKLLETYDGAAYADRTNGATWASRDPATRWKACEVATQLSRAYAFGDFIPPAKKDPARGLAIARAGTEERCGGTAYWLGRIYEEGDALVPGVDKLLGKYPQSTISWTYDVAILNGFTPAYERMAELYRLGGPARYRGKTYYVFPADSYPYWRRNPNDNDQLFMMRSQYSLCLTAEPTNLVCARGLRWLYHNPARDSSDGYTNFDESLAAYYDTYVKNLESLLAKAGQPVPPEVR